MPVLSPWELLTDRKPKDDKKDSHYLFPKLAKNQVKDRVKPEKHSLNIKVSLLILETEDIF